MKKRLFAIILVLVLTFSFSACSKKEETPTWEGENPIVTMTMENGGVVKIELYPDEAPVTVQNFIDLIEDGFYDGLTFHRVIDGFMIQGGDPQGTGMGGAENKIVGEFSDNGYDNNISHTRGVISMARSAQKDSASSQFFIVHEDATFLDGAYAGFGEVVEGMDVIDEIAQCEKVVGSDGAISSPVDKVIIKSMTVEYNK